MMMQDCKCTFAQHMVGDGCDICNQRPPKKPMIEINFDEQFADDVEDGTKTRTIRSRPYCKPGDKISLVTGVGGPHIRQLAQAVCTAVRPIKIDDTCMSLDGRRLRGGNALRGETEDRDNDFARKDGFDGFMEMADYIEKVYGPLPFEGFLIEWNAG